jgi:[ribosomal protein S5]-alanine N-acetyltransferase
MNVENYLLDKLQPIDCNQLYQFMSNNAERLKLFFPITLEMNSSLEKTEVYISIKNKEIEEKTNFTLAIRDKSNQQIVRLIIIKKIDWDIKQGEFAYCIGSELEGKGVTSFAVKEMTNFAFEDLGLKTIQIIAHKTNLGSVKVAKNNGFIWQKTLQNEFIPTDGIPLDMELYELKK